MYLDLNDDGRLDPGEPTAISDANGSYNFGQLPDKPFVARIVLPNKNVVETNPFDSDVFDPATETNMQYLFALRRATPQGQSSLAATLRKQLHRLTAGVKFWAGKAGEALVRAVNGGPQSTQLGSWLASTRPNLYGAGGHDRDGKTNADVAQYFQQLKATSLLDAEVLATALSVT